MSQTPNISRRPAAQMMTLRRLGSLHQSRLSFMRILTRRMAHEAWRFTRPVFDIGANGVGRAVYTATGPDRAYSLIAFAHDLPDDQRSDRVIAEAWDATFTLFDGIPTQHDLNRLAQNVPYQEAGRVTETELTLSRANRSTRLWTHVVTALAGGQQPDTRLIDEIGYLMRTTAVYGSGKFGAADRETIANRPEMQVPFQAEMLSVYLIRTFTRDLVQHMARAQGGDRTAVLDPAIARRLGIGNSTGLGMAPFLVNHPILFSNWIAAREEAIARVRALETTGADQLETFRACLAGFTRNLANWHSDHPGQQEKLAALRIDVDGLNTHLQSFDFAAPFPWHRLMDWAETTLSGEGQESLASLVLEPHGALIDDLADTMADSAEAGFRIDGTQLIAALRDHLETNFAFARDADWAAPEATARAWYVSEEKLEPRLGERAEEPIEPYEQPLAPARDAAAALTALSRWPGEAPIASFLLKHPEHRHTIRRAQMTARAPYGEIQGNTIAADLQPIDMLRAKLSFFGATRFDPRSDRWVRITMFGGAPYPEELGPENADHWVYPAP